jgi:hypothetical protein
LLKVSAGLKDGQVKKKWSPRTNNNKNNYHNNTSSDKDSGDEDEKTAESMTRLHQPVPLRHHLPLRQVFNLDFAIHYQIERVITD